VIDDDMGKQHCEADLKAHHVVDMIPPPITRHDTRYRGDYRDYCEDDDEELHRAIMASLQLSPRLSFDEKEHEPTNTSCSTSTASSTATTTTNTNHSRPPYTDISNFLPPTPEEMDDETQLAIEMSLMEAGTISALPVAKNNKFDDDNSDGLDDATLSPDEREAMRLAIQETRNEQLQAFRDEWKAELSSSSTRRKETHRVQAREIKLGSDVRYHVGRAISADTPQQHEPPSQTKKTVYNIV
jgi:hypothetical protein